MSVVSPCHKAIGIFLLMSSYPEPVQAFLGPGPPTLASPIPRESTWQPTGCGGRKGLESPCRHAPAVRVLGHPTWGVHGGPCPLGPGGGCRGRPGPALPRLWSGPTGALGGGCSLTVRPAPSGADGAGHGAAALGRPVPAGPRPPAPRPAAAALLPAALPPAAGAPVLAAAGGPGPGAAEERPARGEWGGGGRRGTRGRTSAVTNCEGEEVAGAGGQGGPAGGGSICPQARNSRPRTSPSGRGNNVSKAQRRMEAGRGRVRGAAGKPRQERPPAGLGKFA